MRRFLAAALLCRLAAPPLQAQDETSDASRRVEVQGPHVRADGADTRALLLDAAEKSATFRDLLERIDESDLIVYVRMQHFGALRLEGRIGFVSGAGAPGGGPRILLIELACPRSVDQQQATLAHELRHATEIGDAVWVTGPATLAEYYRRIGESASSSDHGIAFETAAARETASRVRREVSAALKLTHED